MKKILLFGAIALSTLTFGQNIPSYVPTNGLVGWWPFNGNANDESGNGNDAVLVNTSNFQNGYSNEGVFIEGENALYYSNGGYVEFPNIGTSFNNEFTFTYWVNLDTILYDVCGFGGERYLAIGNGNTQSNELSMYIPPSCNNAFIFRCGTSTERLGIRFDSLMYYDNWHLISMTGVNNVCSTYIDGSYVGSFTGNTNLSQFDFSKFYFGRHYWGSNNSTRFKGMFDEFGIWNRVLTQQEITALYTGCSTITATITPQGNTTFCQGNSVVLEATAGSNYTYQWYNNGNAINGETNQTYTATTSGNYTVKVIDGACDATSSATSVTVNSNPTVSFSLSSMISNDNGNITLNGSPSGGSYTGNGITGNILDPSVVNLGKQTIVYDYTDNNGCSGSKTSTTVIYDTTGTVCSTYDTTFITIDVYDTTFVTQTIYDTITIENQVSVTDTLIIDVSLAGLNPPNNINTMKVYPNPSNDVVNIDNGDYALMNGYSIKIINSLGQEKFSNAINIPAFQIPVSQLGATGVYYINIYDNQSQLIESKVLVLE